MSRRAPSKLLLTQRALEDVQGIYDCSLFAPKVPGMSAQGKLASASAALGTNSVRRYCTLKVCGGRPIC